MRAQQITRRQDALLRLLFDQQRLGHALDRNGETGCGPVAGGRLHHGSDDIGMCGDIARTEHTIDFALDDFEFGDAGSLLGPIDKTNDVAGFSNRR